MMETVRACIEQHADASPDRPFLIAPDIGKTLSFAELKVAVDDVGGRLDRLGISRGAKVAFLLNNGYWTLGLFLGVMANNRIIVLLNAVAGAHWVSVHHGGGVGIGYAIHAGMVVVADGSNEAAERLERVLTTDPGTGIMRHVDAGYPEAIDAARRHDIKIPMLDCSVF